MSRFTNTNGFPTASQRRWFAKHLLSLKICATASLLIIALSAITGCNDEKSEIDQIIENSSTNNQPTQLPKITDARVRAE
ncbi:MAG: hypothetical protein ACKVK0_14570, partial [Pirellulales bacterium]